MQTPSTPERQAARAAGLRYVDDTQPGISRRRAGKGFSYRDADGHAIRDATTLQRIRALAIPPAYTAVWICAHANGHLQATGRDARGRKQYRYHADWAKERDAGKFDRIIAFGEALPTLRRRLSRDLKRPGFPQEKVLAMVVALLADTLVRVGNETYAQQNRSFGLTTLRNRHLELLRGGRVRMRFRGKSGQLQEVTVGDRKLGLLVRRLQQLPGQALFQYRDDDGALQPVDSGAVNDYLREVMGEDFTAKDFRTWGGTVAAVQAFAATELPAPASQRALAPAPPAGGGGPPPWAPHTRPHPSNRSRPAAGKSSRAWLDSTKPGRRSRAGRSCRSHPPARLRRGALRGWARSGRPLLR